jgi:hypothetical protein
LGSDGCAAPPSADSALKSLTSSEGRIHGCNVLPAVGMSAIEKTMTVTAVGQVLLRDPNSQVQRQTEVAQPELRRARF